MKLAAWNTGHQIADTVAQHIDADAHYGTQLFNEYEWAVSNQDTHIAYGILRGTDKVFQECDKQNKHWFNIDRGYWDANHFDGNYRISYKGTQAKWHDDIPKADVDVEMEDWVKPSTFMFGNTMITAEGFYLICPPTDAVCNFFDIDSSQWLNDAWRLCKKDDRDWIIRKKGDEEPIDWSIVEGVITFNSSIGWQALQRGIPCVSDTTHSLVGSYYKHELSKKNLEYNLDNVKLIDRRPLFRAMGGHQFTLMEMRQGKAWDLLNHYLKVS